jgi:hypothetical protein
VRADRRLSRSALISTDSIFRATLRWRAVVVILVVPALSSCSTQSSRRDLPNPAAQAVRGDIERICVRAGEKIIVLARAQRNAKARRDRPRLSRVIGVASWAIERAATSIDETVVSDGRSAHSPDYRGYATTLHIQARYLAQMAAAVRRRSKRLVNLLRRQIYETTGLARKQAREAGLWTCSGARS